MHSEDPGTVGASPGAERADSAPESPEELARMRELERVREVKRQAKEAQLTEAWEAFMEREREELELRKNGQLARLLGETLPGEPPEALARLAREDQKQARAGLVTLTSGEKTSYKHIDELTREDMPARIAANALRTTWLKERRDGWLADVQKRPSL